MINSQPGSQFRLLITALICITSVPLLAQRTEGKATQPDPQREINEVIFDVSQLHHDSASNGDTWDYAWAEDGALYTFNCDGRGYGNYPTQNLSFNKLIGSRWNDLVGSSVNPMDYGIGGQKQANLSNWKTTGADSIDGSLYAFVANNWYGNQNAYGGPEPDPHIRQTVMNMSLIRSTDHGKTWMRDPATNYAQPMWSSPKFSTAFFVKYGQDGGRTTQDAQDKYVYAISNDGYWNCGSHFYLGRVLRSKIGRLLASDWEFYANVNWTHDVERATALPGFANGQMKEAMGSVLWLAALHKYITVTWFDPGTSEKWHYPENVTFALYESDHPWGPWNWIGEKSASDFIADRKSRIHRWYGPSLSPKFISENPDGSVTVILLFSGQTWEDTPQSLYKNNSLPVTLYTAPLPMEVRTFNDTDAKFLGEWQFEAGTRRGDYHDDVHTTKTPKAEAEFSFEGTGIEVLSEKSSDMGTLEIVLDGESKGTVSLYQDPMPLLYQVEVYRNVNLKHGHHTIRVINRSPVGKRVLVDGFRVYGGMDLDPNARYSLVNRATGDAIVVRNGLLTAAPIKSGEDAARWQVKDNDAGFYTLSPGNLSRSIGNDGEDGTTTLVDAAADQEKARTLWRIRPVGNGTFSITNRVTDLAISETLVGPSQSSISQLEYMGRDAQKWEIVRSDSPATKVR